MKTLFLLFFVVFASTAQAQPNLIGQWTSDAALTMQFNKEQARLEGPKANLLSQLMGRMTLTFTPETITSEMPEWEYRADSGKQHRFSGFKETHSYRPLAHTLNTIAVLSVEPVSGIESISVYNFDNPDTMWVYTGGSDKFFPNQHLREYFVRIR